MMKRFLASAACVLIVSVAMLATATSAQAQSIRVGFGSYGPGFGGYRSGFGYGYGPGISLRIGPSLNYGGYGSPSIYRTGGVYGGGFYGVGGYGGISRNVYSYGHVGPAYTVRRPVTYGYSRGGRRCR